LSFLRGRDGERSADDLGGSTGLRHNWNSIALVRGGNPSVRLRGAQRWRRLCSERSVNGGLRETHFDHSFTEFLAFRVDDD
jgi:hypothetical protein